MGWGTEDAGGVEGREEGDEAAAVETRAGGGQDENIWCRQWCESTCTTSPKPNTAQKPWNKTMVEAESYEAGPPNDQTRTMKIELLIKTSNKNYTHSTSVGSDSLGRWFYN